MKAFYYEPAHVGMKEFPPGYFKLSEFLATSEPAEADCYVLPCDLRHVTDVQLTALPYLGGNEQRHVFFSLAEFPKRALPFDALAIRTDFNKGLARVNPSSRVWCWGVEDLGRYRVLPMGGFEHDVHAQMWASTPLTDEVVESCLKVGLRVHDQRNPFFYGTLESANDERLPELRRTFLESMQRSRLVLVPRSRAGVNRYRFFEALSMGRIPVLLCDDCLLPLADRINYERCSVRIHEADAKLTGTYLKEWLQHNDDVQLMARGEYGRAMWQQWLSGAQWERTWSTLAREHLEAQRVLG